MMKELSLNILDIAKNSVTAGAGRVTIELDESFAGVLRMCITDDGCGMDADMVARVTDPFTTTRTTRKVGMGIPLLKMAAEMTGGGFDIQSEPGKGTRVEATFKTGHIDFPPLGDLAGSIVTLIQGSDEIDFHLVRKTPKGEYELDTAELRQTLEGVPLGEPEVLGWIDGYIRENEQAIA